MFWSPEKYLMDPQSMNSYSYARNNPIMMNDKSGLTPIDTLAGTFYGIGKFAVDTVVGAGQLVLYKSTPYLLYNPDEAVNIVKGIPQIPGAIVASIEDTANTIAYGNDFDSAAAISYNTAFIASLFIGVGEEAAASKAARIARLEAKAVVGGGSTVIESSTLSSSVFKNFQRFTSKIPANSKNSAIIFEKDGNFIFEATSEGKVPGSRAVYQKTVDSGGVTTGYTKTTYDPSGQIVHIKNKLNK